jgi:hypothetical protein
MAIAAALVLLAGCTSAPSPVPTPSTNGPTVSPPAGNFHLTVSNQSFREPHASLSVIVDGRLIVAKTFDVEGQHNFEAFTVQLSPGAHRLVARAASGARHTARFTIPARKDRYGVLLYWNEGRKRAHFTWQAMSTPPGFG